MSIPTVFDQFREFHRDEDGMQTLDTILIVAVVALILGPVLRWAKTEYLTFVQQRVIDVLE